MQEIFAFLQWNLNAFIESLCGSTASEESEWYSVSNSIFIKNGNQKVSAK